MDDRKMGRRWRSSASGGKASRRRQSKGGTIFRMHYRVSPRMTEANMGEIWSRWERHWPLARDRTELSGSATGRDRPRAPSRVE